MSAHTPGPWRLTDENRVRRVIRGGAPAKERTVCIIESWTTEPDARLIAAAPDLLEVLRGLLVWADAVAPRAGVRMSDPNTGSIEAARAAIAKAEGKTP